MKVGAIATAVLASANAGKVAELGAVLAPLGVDLRPMAEFGVAAPAETGLTFVENALLKARHTAEATGLASVADDSGLVVPALGGAPGLYSARYGGPGASAEDNNAKLVEALKGVADRRAAFHCALVWLEAPLDPAPIVAFGVWRGVIVNAPRGVHGFGYDPHFFLPTLGVTAAELAPARKNRLSHRAAAARQLAMELAKRRPVDTSAARLGRPRP